MSKAWEESYRQLGKALDRLGEALASDLSESIVMDATIQRFEFCAELTWKTLQKLLFAFEGVETGTPRQVFQEAYRARWIDDEGAWMVMLKDRNLSSHTYKEALAKEIYGRIPGHYALMQKTYAFMTNTINTRQHGKEGA